MNSYTVKTILDASVDSACAGRPYIGPAITNRSAMPAVIVRRVHLACRTRTKHANVTSVIQAAGPGWLMTP